MERNAFRRSVAWICFLIWLMPIAPTPSWSLPRFWDDLIRESAKIADDVPLRNLDEAAEGIRGSSAAREALEKQLRQMERITEETSESARAAVRMEQITKILHAAGDLSPATLKQLDTLEPVAREAAAVIVHGGRTIRGAVPDIVQRGHLIRAGGADLLTAAGLYGDSFMDEAMRFKAILDAGGIAVPAGRRAITFQDFVSTVVKYKDPAWDFIQTYIRPHWKMLAGSGLVAAFLLEPDLFIDTAGQLTKHALQEFSRLGIEVSAAVAEGTADGIRQGVRTSTERLFDGFDLYTIIGISGLFIGIGLFFKRTRYYIAWPFRWLNTSFDD